MQGNSYWKDRSVFVTGATGLMGGWLTQALLDEDANVVALVRDNLPRTFIAYEGLEARITLVRGDLLDETVLRRSFAEYSIDTVFHLAAQPLVGVAKRDPVGTLEANIRGTWLMLEAARQSNVKQFIMASSDKAYGAHDKLPYVETHALQGEYPYDASKSCADLICRMFAKTYGMKVGIARCGNLFGGGDFNLSRMIPGLIESTYRGERFEIRSDGKFVRDFLYVRDGASAYMKLTEKLAEMPELGGEAFNFSLCTRLTVLELVHKILDLMGRHDLEPIILNQASNEIREQYLNCDKAKTVLGWSPAYSLEAGLEETIGWYTRMFSRGKRSANV